MNVKIIRKIIAAGAISGALISPYANSALYISPVIKDSVTYEKEYVKDTDGTYKAEQIEGKSTIHGDFMMREHDSKQALLRFGENVPLFIALEKVVPNSDEWAIHFDDGLENIAVDWDGGQSWEGILDIISNNSGIDIFINNQKKAIGVSRNKKLAEAMAHQKPQVWKLSSRKGLQENLKEWARSVNKDLIFSEQVKNINYGVPDITVVGSLVSKGGAIDQVLTNLNRTAHVKLEAKISADESQIIIVRAGHKKEMF